jgi:hypothetical protein
MITMKQGDTLPQLSITCTDDGAPVDLTTAVGIRVLGSRHGIIAFDYVGTGSALGIVTAQWDAQDTAAVGIITVEVEVTWPAGGGVQTFPAGGHLRISIERRLPVIISP